MKKAGKPYVYVRAESLGIPVVDALESILVTVTDHDVINAKKSNSKHCALARSALRIPGVHAAYFFRTTAFLEYEDRMLRFVLPASVQREIVCFDRARVFAAGVYQLSTVPPTSAQNNAPRKSRQRRRRMAARASELVNNRPIEQSTRPGVRPSTRAELASKIARIASDNPVNDSPEQREFNTKVAGIMGMAAKTVLGPRKHIHKTQYVRTMEDPERGAKS